MRGKHIKKFVFSKLTMIAGRNFKNNKKDA
jgi:hypothetical protein